MKKLMSLLLLASSFSVFAMSDSQVERLAAAQMKQYELSVQKDFQTKKCLAEKILDMTNSNVRAVEVYSIRHTIVENVLNTIFLPGVTNYEINFAFLLDNKKVKVACGIWSKDSNRKSTDLFQHCSLENGKKLNTGKYHRYAISPVDWFVIEKGCL